jgi:hypothetical protein
MKAPKNEIWTTEDLALYLRVSPETVRSWRRAGSGPPYAKLGDGKTAAVRYRRCEVAEWLKSREV